MKSEKLSLIGEAVGFANAALSHGENVNKNTFLLIREILSKTAPWEKTTREELEALSQKLASEKKRAAPDCAVCAFPCGRNNPCDVEAIVNTPGNARDLKTAILLLMHALSSDEEIFIRNGETVLSALRAVGDEWSGEGLYPFIKSLGAAAEGKIYG